jgi:hypothetical protein
MAVREPVVMIGRKWLEECLLSRLAEMSGRMAAVLFDLIRLHESILS